MRTLEDDVLTLHLVVGAALAWRTTDAHVYRAARQAHRSARVALGWEGCGLCGDPVPCRAWMVWGEAVHAVAAVLHLGERVYCSADHAAWVLVLNRKHQAPAQLEAGA